MVSLTKRDFIGIGIAGAVLTGSTFGIYSCVNRKKTPPPPDGEPVAAGEEGTLEWAVAGGWRNPLNKARDPFRHPLETLKFFGVKPGDTIIDVWPGAGYMTEILAPYLARGKGKYIAALFENSTPAEEASEVAETDAATSSQAVVSLGEQYTQHFGDNKKLFGEIGITEFGPNSTALAPAGTADVVLFFLNIHDWMAAGIAEKAFADAFAALKSGGVLAVEQHRADIGNVQDPAATSGYVQEPFVKQLASEAGFTFVEASEINANPKDSKDHPFGVWTLPPQRLTAKRGEPSNPDFDGALYESIGESDRMTLKFRKP
ncbi:class I SAM-dependent methyltransferase [Asticcacaulis machinosus]|uniref:Methyltransferase n=1 Tax=Asticcacaulis machinosus TaxID=2984211 RepID=A0ABT5HMC7_9CAUL|nr:methyltransferase [Asticcacaulis machinosus]MDC7677368.1 methyltransferase [Asticcacaulis machinosus]